MFKSFNLISYVNMFPFVLWLGSCSVTIQDTDVKPNSQTVNEIYHLPSCLEKEQLLHLFFSNFSPIYQPNE